MAPHDPVITTGLLMAIERQVNALISLDPVVFKRLSAYAGSVIRVQVHTPDTEFFIHLEDNRFRLSGIFDGECDAVFRGSSISLATLIVQRPANFAETPGVEVHGCSELLNELQTTHNLVDLDWQSVVYLAFGDLGGLMVTKGLRFVNWHVQQSQRLIVDNAGGFIQEELHMAPSRPEVDWFMDEVNLLVKSVNRLEVLVKEQAQLTKK